MQTYGVKYIGSKNALVPYILKSVEDHCPTATTAIDVFTGTTRVAQALKAKGLTVTTSDLSWASACYSDTWIGNGDNKHLQTRIDELNALAGVNGWLTTNYCDARGEKDGIVRVWQAKNGKRADAIRDKIETLTNLEPWEKNTLITSLILALDKVDNTVGVQQAYLKDWCNRSFNEMELQLPTAPTGPKGQHLVGDCLTLNYPTADFAYLDPPYSSHSYSTYYHIWDSIAAWDKPAVGLKTNRRADRISGNDQYDASMMSAWNSKKTALGAFEKLIQRLPVKKVIVSYNDESLVDSDSLLKMFRKFPSVIVQEIDYKRNIMCQIGNAAKDNTTFKTENKELLFVIEKAS